MNSLGLNDSELFIINNEYDFSSMNPAELIETAKMQAVLIKKLYKLSLRDPLTGLYNNSAIRNNIQSFLENEGKNGTHCLMFLDIDNFKYINDNSKNLRHVLRNCAALMILFQAEQAEMNFLFL